MAPEQGVREDMIKASYITDLEFEHDLARLDATDFLTLSSIICAAWERR